MSIGPQEHQGWVPSDDQCCGWSHDPPTRSSAEVGTVHACFTGKKGFNCALKTLRRDIKMQWCILLQCWEAPPKYKPNVEGHGQRCWDSGSLGCLDPWGPATLLDELLVHVWSNRRSDKSLWHLPWAWQPSIKDQNSREAAWHHTIPSTPCYTD